MSCVIVSAVSGITEGAGCDVPVVPSVAVVDVVTVMI
jgi:hypothetical protein